MSEKPDTRIRCDNPHCLKTIGEWGESAIIIRNKRREVAIPYSADEGYAVDVIIRCEACQNQTKIKNIKKKLDK